MYHRETFYERAQKQIKRNATLVFVGNLLLVFAITPAVVMLAYSLFILAFWPTLPVLGFWPFFFALWALRILVTIIRGK